MKINFLYKQLQWNRLNSRSLFIFVSDFSDTQNYQRKTADGLLISLEEVALEIVNRGRYGTSFAV